jgi:drug/metabolite transporter (DMT)-like permease
VSKNLAGMSQLLAGAMAIGLAPVFVKLLTTTAIGVGPVAAGFWRMAIGSAGFAALAFARSGKAMPAGSPRFNKRFLWMVTLAGVLFALDLSAWHTSFKYTTVASSTLIANLSSVLVPVCGVVFFGEPLRRGMIGGGVLAIVGVAGLALGRSNGLGIDAQRSLVLGEGLAFLTAFFYTGYMLTIKSITRTVTPGVVMLWSSLFSAVVLFAVCLALGEAMIPADASGWIYLAGLGLVSQFAGQGLIARALVTLPVSRSALLLLSAPASSTVFGWLFLDERLTLVQILGVLLTLAGIAIVGATARRE